MNTKKIKVEGELFEPFDETIENPSKQSPSILNGKEEVVTPTSITPPDWSFQGLTPEQKVSEVIELKKELEQHLILLKTLYHRKEEEDVNFQAAVEIMRSEMPSSLTQWNTLNYDQPDTGALIKKVALMLYQLMDKRTGLYFSVDKHIVFGSSERKTRSMTEEVRAKVKKEKEATPGLLSAGYGEITKGCFHKVHSGFFSTSVPEELRPISGQSAFLDIGAGFGKCVFHSSLLFDWAQAHGVEIVKNRYLLSLETLADMHTLPTEAKNLLRLKSVQFKLGDVTNWSFKQIENYTHLYSFDPVFSFETKTKLIWCTTISPVQIKSFGGLNFKLLHKISGITTTGHQSFTFFYYGKSG